MLPLKTVCLVSIGLTLVCFGLSIASATAQTTFTFTGNYDTMNSFTYITPDNVEVFPLWENIEDAPYGLTKLSGLIYGQTDFSTGNQSFNTDPKVFGLQDVPPGFIVLEGSGSDKLFATDVATATIDFNTSTARTVGIYGITGGEGRFTGVTGELNFIEVGKISPNPTDPFIGRASVNGSFQVVPEPRTDTALVATGVIGSCVLWQRRRLSSTSST